MKYSAKWSQREAARKARRPKPRRLDHAPLREKVWELLRANWSPEQIAAMLPVLFPRDLRMRVSHETIYQSLFVQTKGELKRELTAHLRTRRQHRKAQTGGAKRVTLGITDDIRISARPAEVEDRAVPGHRRATCCSAASARAPCSRWSNGPRGSCSSHRCRASTAPIRPGGRLTR
ncbi:hypothetical protein NCI01_21320 [Nocardioides sp. STR3]|uniref:Transposase n=1 Tax=Nocardioides pinisoli TaxID=2950279 RepID=A0ABT1L377_9ACTN|nr:hypothetical protein [Nocardioides pinisoli]MCP3424347.1 hypothetical protein [Nocardioides pinisoli]